MKLVETTVSEDFVRLRLADDASWAKAAEWVDLRAPLQSLRHRRGDPIAPPESQLLLEVQIAALRHAQAAIRTEIGRLEGLVGRSRV